MISPFFFRSLAAPLAAGLVLAAGHLASPLTLRAQSAEGNGVSLPIGSEAPAVVIEDLDGNPVDLAELIAGRPALIEFWASWCDQCEALQPQLDELSERHGEGFAIVAIAVGVNQTPRRVIRHLSRHEAAYPYLWDGKGDAVRAYDAFVTSTVVMLDAEGRVRYTGTGADQDLVRAAQRLLEG